MSERFDIVTARQYADKTTGEIKTAWTLIGRAFQTSKGWSLMFDALPIPQMGKDGQIETRALLMPPKGKNATAELPEPSSDEVPW